MRQTSFFIRYKLHHLLFWMLLSAGWYFFRYEDFSRSTTARQMIAVKVIDLALLVYLTNYILIPGLLYRRRYLSFSLLYFFLVIAFSVLKMLVEGEIMNRPDMFNFSTNLKLRVYDNIIPHFLLVSTGAAFKIMIDYARAQKRLVALARENAETELNFLKSQMNPHFLFNSLNAVFFLINKENREARNALHKFSDMLRYQLYECSADKIAVEKEVAYLKDYIDLQKLRGDENCSIEFNCDPAVKNFMIEPLLLIPFVENAFKHLSHFQNGDRDTIKITMTKSTNAFVFTVVNSTESAPAGSGSGKNGGIGLPNVERRLQLLYPGRYQLVTRKIDRYFEAVLTITINHKTHETTLPDNR